MWGCSATGGSQMQAAATRPPSLKAIFPLSPNFDAYDFLNYGGVPSPTQAGGQSRAARDALASPVDGPDGPALLAQAISEHEAEPEGTQGGLPFRDSRSEFLGGDWWTLSSASAHVEALQRGGFGVYAAGNWDESGTKLGPAHIFGNVPRGRGKLLLAPEGHCAWPAVEANHGFSIQTEELRFFDYWLKGVDNGVMDEPPVTYFTYNAPKETAWRQAASWPLPDEVRTPFFLATGAIARTRPATSGHDSAAMAEPGRATSTSLTQAKGGLTFETAPLDADLEVTGHPVARLWISTSAADADVTTQIEDVAPDGASRSYQMVGRLRASHRALARPPYNNFGMPYHTHLSSDVRPLEAGKAVELNIAMMPMSYIFPKGHRIRLTVTFADPARAATAPTVVLLHGPETPSALILPVIAGR